MANPHPEWTADDWREHTEDARREARFKHASERIRKIVDGAPKLTDDQLSQLAVLLHGGGGE